MTYHWLIALTMTIGYSCDYHINIHGKILLYNSDIPVQGAKIELVNRNISVLSGATGDFNIGEHTGRSYNPVLRITKENYKPFEIELDHEDNSKVYKVKTESVYHHLDEPFYPNPNNEDTYLVNIPLEKYSQNFKLNNDTIIVHLEHSNIQNEIESLKIKHRNGANWK